MDKRGAGQKNIIIDTAKTNYFVTFDICTAATEADNLDKNEGNAWDTP